MTLDFKKFILNHVKKQMSVQHFECDVQLFKRDELNAVPHIVDKLKEIYGNNGILDGDYWLFFTGTEFTQDVIEKTLFKIVNAALGNSANSLTESDFKKFSLDGANAAPAPVPATEFADAALTNDNADAANDDAVADVVSGGKENEINESAETGREFVCVKITMK